MQISLGGLTFGKTISFPGGPIGSSLGDLALLDLRSDGKVSYTVQTSLHSLVGNSRFMLAVAFQTVDLR